MNLEKGMKIPLVVTVFWILSKELHLLIRYITDIRKMRNEYFSINTLCRTISDKWKRHKMRTYYERRYKQ